MKCERATGVKATIVKGVKKGKPFGDVPKWWYSVLEFNASNKALGGYGWRKGHLLPRTFGGPGGTEKKNVAPWTFILNNTNFKPCENRIEEYLNTCDCVKYQLTVRYDRTAPDQLLIPSSFDLLVTDINDMTLISINMPNDTTIRFWSACAKK